MHFTRLRLVGFKSFVDSTELLIEPGLTGVVGPNGCGKSNLLEALRWVMGESSARQMRGGEMDDVIFGGTSERPARNLAEVSLTVDNSARDAPAAMNNAPELEITRRIERGAGSSYRLNGRDTRARDVQLLFADAATGARSPSMVSQGRVAALIQGRPTDRRAILEDAAGIAGLQTRRHEAELRLAAAETNLTRLEDVQTELNQQASRLQREARQAARYRALGEAIRDAESQALAIRWAAATRARTAAAEAREQAETAVAEATRAASQAATLQAQAAAILPERRDAQAAASAARQALALEEANLAAEERRLADAAATVDARLAELERDLTREAALETDASGAVERLTKDAEGLRARQASAPAALKAAEVIAADKASTVTRLEADRGRLAERVAADTATRAALTKRAQEFSDRRARLDREAAEARSALDRLEAERRALPDPASVEAAVVEAVQALEAGRARLEKAAAARQAAEQAASAALRTLQEIDGRLAKLKGERSGVLASLAPPREAPGAAAILDSVTVATGWEKAFGAALGDDLTAPLATTAEAPLGWRDLGPLPAPTPPSGLGRLIDHVGGPEALRRRLDHIFVAPDAATARATHAALLPGQRVVTQAGDLWRWDGFQRAAGATNAAANRLIQRNRLTALDAELATVETERARLADAAKSADAGLSAARAEEQSARTAERGLVEADRAKREAKATLATSLGTIEARAQGIATRLHRAEADLAEVSRQTEETKAQIAALGEPARDQIDLERATSALAQARAAASSAATEAARLAREADGVARRVAALTTEITAWRDRSAGTQARRTELEGRRADLLAKRDEFARRPEEFAKRRRRLVEEIAAADNHQRATGAALLEAEARLAETDRAARAASAMLSSTREAMVRAESQVEQAIEQAAEVARTIAERLHCAPDALTAPPDMAPLDFSAASHKLERLTRERDAMGPVNLRAEAEMQELEARATALAAEREDLTEAIRRLRTGIAGLNRDGRERLTRAFDAVNGHFQELFTRLMGGGKATLQLTDLEDPLAAGLEIFASPPGKRMQLLSLLSGGEQALTALALLFAVFLTNPSPICVLDEVDAPLDDANVDRFCALLTDIAATSGTRFLVITHHRMTMARMDRLFGVTMMERGVSRLVSVDLGRAEKLVATG